MFGVSGSGDLAGTEPVKYCVGGSGLGSISLRALTEAFVVVFAIAIRATMSKGLAYVFSFLERGSKSMSRFAAVKAVVVLLFLLLLLLLLWLFPSLGFFCTGLPQRSEYNPRIRCRGVEMQTVFRLLWLR